MPYPGPIFRGPSNPRPVPHRREEPKKKGPPMKLEDFPVGRFDRSLVPMGTVEGDKVECQVCL